MKPPTVLPIKTRSDNPYHLLEMSKGLLAQIAQIVPTVYNGNPTMPLDECVKEVGILLEQHAVLKPSEAELTSIGQIAGDMYSGHALPDDCVKKAGILLGHAFHEVSKPLLAQAFSTIHRRNPPGRPIKVPGKKGCAMIEDVFLKSFEADAAHITHCAASIYNGNPTMPLDECVKEACTLLELGWVGYQAELARIWHN